MSNSKNAISEIKSLMVKFGFLADEKTLQSFKLEDNTILQAEKLEAGKSIVKINDAFEQVTLEDGSYRLVENFEIVVANGEITEVKEIFVDAKLVDGTAIKVEGDSIMEGAAVKVVTVDGEIPAPDGVHELEDGTEIEVKDGVIAKMMGPDQENPAEDQSEPGEAEAEGPSMNMSSEVMEMLKEFVSKMGDKIQKMEEQMNAMNSEFKSFKSAPAGKKISDGKTDFNKQSISEVDARVASLMNMRNK